MFWQWIIYYNEYNVAIGCNRLTCAPDADVCIYLHQWCSTQDCWNTNVVNTKQRTEKGK
jgi:hypothetical protein